MQIDPLMNSGLVGVRLVGIAWLPFSIKQSQTHTRIQRMLCKFNCVRMEFTLTKNPFSPIPLQTETTTTIITLRELIDGVKLLKRV